MNCPYCGAPITEGGTFCGACGASLQAASPAAYTPASVPPVQNPYSFPASKTDDARTFLAKYPEYRPLSAWAYFGLTLLYSIPVIGFIFLIIFTFNSNNLNRRSFTRSYWVGLLLVAIAVGVLFALGFSFSAIF